MTAYKKRALTALALSMSCGLAACGGGGGGASDVADGPRGIYTSTGDCAQSKQFSNEDCRTVISKAIETHRKDAPTYDSQRVCIGNEVYCERAYTNTYRPRLLAFLVQTKKVGEDQTAVEALPLYPPNKREKGLRDLNGKIYTDTDFTIQYSPLSKKALAANPYTEPNKRTY